MRQQPLQVMELLTFEGHYRRRSLWQWVRRRPRVLQPYCVTKIISADGIATIAKIRPL
jgi:hypothetical protein